MMSRFTKISNSVRKHEASLRTLLETIENRRKLLRELQEEYTELLWQKAALLHEIYVMNEELSECDNDSARGFFTLMEDTPDTTVSRRKNS